MNDTQIIVIVVGLGGLLLFMSQKGSDKTPTPEGYVEAPYPYHEKDVEMEEESAPKKGGKKTGHHAAMLEITQHMSKYWDAKIIPYQLKHYTVMSQIDNSLRQIGDGGPMRTDLRRKVEELQEEAMEIGTRWSSYLTTLSEHTGHRSIEEFSQYSIIQECQDNWYRYEAGLNHDTWLINAEQLEQPSYTQNVFIQNVQNRLQQLEQKNFKNMTWNQSHTDARAQQIDLTMGEDDFNASPSGEPPSRLATDSLEHTGRQEALPAPTTNESQIALTGSNQSGFVSNEIPQNHHLAIDQSNAAAVAQNGMTSSQQMLIKGGGAKPSPLAIEDDPERDKPFVTTDMVVREPVKNEDPPQRSRSRSRSPTRAGQETSRSRTRSESPATNLPPLSIEDKPALLAIEDVPGRGRKRGRETDAAPDPKENMIDQIPENSAKKPRPPDEFQASEKRGGHKQYDSILNDPGRKTEAPDINPHFHKKVEDLKNAFLKADAEKKEGEMGVLYWKIGQAAPSGGAKGMYWSKAEQKKKTVKGNTFWYIAERGLDTARMKMQYSTPVLQDLVDSPEYQWWSKNIWPIVSRRMNLITGGKKYLSLKEYQKMAKREAAELAALR